ncbi:MAG: sugar nucleotide-binding protein [Gemmatimonadaceae bacterium]|nr:sugar nucleotide-binding protein [Gemmatimonadaceae bacterium]
MTRPALWGGIECTVNRVGGEWFDQVRRSGHDARVSDIDRFADLGISAMRYPMLWERMMADSSRPRWERVEPFVERLLQRGVAPIAGLVHHGSGPAWAPISDAAFAERLADYASAAAKRFGAIRDWTPVNEPLTTARFCGLYGHWYPHGRNDATFVRILLNECRAIVLSMQAIRAATPGARLIQTDDAGTITATPALAQQAEFENLRRDLALDLLCGRVDAAHPLANYLLQHGARERELSWFLEHPTPPDVIGIDYYATSDRWLDDRISQYPADVLGGNGRTRYADVAATRHDTEWRPGFRRALDRWHAKYHRPVALTEVHLGCTREEQLRWLHEAWSGACAAREAGTPVEAVTPWALLGTHDWNRLVTSAAGHYESGAFDIRSPKPRATALAGAIRELSMLGHISHPVAAQSGWWQGARAPAVAQRAPARSRLLILGAGGTLGAAFVRMCRARGLPHLALTREQVDVVDAMQVRRAVAACRPWGVINATGYVHVDQAEVERERCMAVNTAGTRHLGDACRRTGARLLTFSSDLVFDGAVTRPYDEDDAPNPLNVYGASKFAGERELRELGSDALVVRTSAFFGPWDSANYVVQAMRAFTLGAPFLAPQATISPTYVPALVDAALDLLIDGESGIWHLSSHEAVTWGELARRVAMVAGFDAALVEECEGRTAGWVAARPSYSALGSRRAWIMPSLERSLESFMDSYRRDAAPTRAP